MTVKEGDKIKVDYEGRLEDGTVFDSSTHKDHSHPLEFEVGSGKLIKGFDSAVIGMKPGEEKKITLKSEEAYGEYNDKLVQTVPKTQLPPGQTPEVGMGLMISTPQGHQIPAKIVEVTDESVKIDANHPLVGKTLIFKIKLLEIL